MSSGQPLPAEEMRPGWSGVLLTTLIGTAQGLYLVVFAIDVSRSPPRDFVVASSFVSLLLLAAGLVASFFHLGRPGRAWRAASQWRTSWLSREVIVLPAFMGLVLLYGLLQHPLVGWLAALACVALFACTAMVYIGLTFLQEWHTPLTFINFLLLGLASGLTLSVPIAVLYYGQFAGPLALAAFGVGALAWIVRGATLIRNARLQPKSTIQGAKPQPLLGAVRWVFLILIFPLPGWLLGWGGGTLAAYAAAFLLQFAGLLAERWYFFAEARHPQNLYCQSMA